MCLSYSVRDDEVVHVYVKIVLYCGVIVDILYVKSIVEMRIDDRVVVV